MKRRLMEFIRCPACRAALQLLAPELQQEEVMAGTLACAGCRRQYPIEAGVPRLLARAEGQDSRLTSRTAASYSVLWSRSDDAEAGRLATYHIGRMEQQLELAPAEGLVLDAGCGEGIDVVHQAKRPGVEVIGVELSDGGCQTSRRRSQSLPSAHVAQADLCRLPFEDGRFDVVYSYGVLHHLVSPQDGLRELARVLKPGGRIAIYLYEDFSRHAAGWQWLLAAANAWRPLTTRLPHRVLYRLCQALSPVIYVCLTIPARIGARIPGLRSVAERLPYRHGTGPFSMTGDLYDRFATPIERRYTKADALKFLQDAGLQPLAVANDRGWMLAGVKPLAPTRAPEAHEYAAS